MSRKVDRLFIIELAIDLRVSKRRIKRDKCGDWNIVGRRGHISTDGLSFYAYVRARSPRHWNAIKRILRFLSVSQDGDKEGIFRIREKPTPEQAVAVRKVFGLRKAPVLTDVQRASRGLNFATNNRALTGDFVDVENPPGAGSQATDKNEKKWNELH